MTGIRRAFLWASIGRYLVMAINLVATLCLARLLTPGDYGISVLGAAIFAIAEAIRALGGGAYLIQQKDLATENIRTSFTVSLIVTLVLAAVIMLSAGPLARYLGSPDLERYLKVSCLAYLTGPVVYPISALMSRQMAFGRIALIGVAAALLNAAAILYLALRGFGSMSFAWAALLSSAASMLLYLHYWRDWRVLRPLLREWRSVIAFGAYDSAAAVLSQLGESLPYLILGKVLNAEAVGLGQRAVLLCLFPERVILAGVGAVALPAFSQRVRDGKSLRGDYLRAIELITAAQWPALTGLVLLAGPIVALVLGPQWRDAVPLIEIIGTALLFSFPISLHYPTLVAVGAIRYLPPAVVVQAVVSIAVLSFLARYGLRAAALSTMLIVPFNGLLSLLLVRHFIGFRWAELGASLSRSVLVLGASAAGPLGLALLAGRDMPIGAALAAVALSAAGWIVGLLLTNHPLLHEARRAGDAFRKSALGTRLVRFGRR